MLRVLGDMTRDSFVVMVGDLPPAVTLSDGGGDANRLSPSERMARIARLAGYESSMVSQFAEPMEIGGVATTWSHHTFAFRPKVMPFHMLFATRPEWSAIARERGGAEHFLRTEVASQLFGVRPWSTDMFLGRDRARPGVIISQLDNPSDSVIGIEPVPHVGLLGELEGVRFSKKVDISPALKDAIVVVRGWFTERSFFQAMASAVGGVFRETEDTYVIDVNPRVWRSMMLGNFDRQIAIAASPSGEEYWIIHKEAFQALTDSDLVQALESEPDARVLRRVAWTSPLGRRIRRYLDYLTSEAFLPGVRELNSLLLANVCWESPISVYYRRNSIQIFYPLQGNPPSMLLQWPG